MAALRSLDVERWEQEVQRLEMRGIRNRWDKEALWAAQVKLRQALARDLKAAA